MVKLFSPFLFVAIFANQTGAQQADYNAIVRKYIQQYKGIAVNEMKVYRIPASITLAQGILESNAGRSELAVEANNHFGIKCHKEWTGKTYYKDDETKHECFRKYDDPLESFRDHSMFLTRRERYNNLFKLDMTDYKGWANGLKSAGYATNPAYAQLLIKTIETYLLNQFDERVPAVSSCDSLVNRESPENQSGFRRFVNTGIGPDQRKIYENNRLRLIIARKEDNLYAIAGDFNIPVGKLLKYNDLPDPVSLKPGQIIYLEHKRRKGSAVFHKVQDGESLYSISQLYGVKLKLIYKRNNLRLGAEPEKGTILRLR